MNKNDGRVSSFVIALMASGSDIVWYERCYNEILYHSISIERNLYLSMQFLICMRIFTRTIVFGLLYIMKMQICYCNYFLLIQLLVTS